MGKRHAAAKGAQKPGRAELQAEVDELKQQVALLAYLHTELAFQAGMAVATLAWLHDERGYHLEQFIESENRLITRARAVKAAKAHQAQATMGLPTPAPQPLSVAP